MSKGTWSRESDRLSWKAVLPTEQLRPPYKNVYTSFSNACLRFVTKNIIISGCSKIGIGFQYLGALVRIQLSSCPQPSSLRRCFKGNLNRIHPGFGHTPVTKKFTFTYSENYEAENKSRWVLDAHMKTFSRAVVVAQLAEQLLPTPEVRGSNLVIGNFYWTNISY